MTNYAFRAATSSAVISGPVSTFAEINALRSAPQSRRLPRPVVRSAMRSTH